MSLDTGPGALISWVTPKSPADTASVKTGDTLLRVNDAPIDVKYPEQLPAANQALLGLTIAQPARILVRREGRELTLTVTPGLRPVAASQPAEALAWGMVAADISASEAREMGRAQPGGVRVLNLRSEQTK